ncbi:D-alanyl-D-alanine carboxypeptidase [Paenibacillus sp. N3/727]|uniref:D-alanyl-D-alanine carboxypeptidase family protein n=1 Tax=Paenibacillus sp. N3/727 TaxID=2925845 RepID=UPI001F5325CC|nr:D-alanyl-D-alanine carboxypeptidase family protein [Paenibacillus sp. N3/727]UNK18562.1 D-alanyl-D-alanine carboxypeptidase [Paenibacillus sp. N3/727]
MKSKTVRKNKRPIVQRTIASVMLMNILCLSAIPTLALAEPVTVATAEKKETTTTEAKATKTVKADKVPSIDTLGLQVRSAVLMEPTTGQVLLSLNADNALPPASMTKMMTEYIVQHEIKQGNLSWDTVVTVKENAAKSGGSRIFLAVNDQHTVEELYIAMAVGSANDAAVALAEHIAGSEQEFVKLMNENAKRMGMKTAHFINATGLSRADMPEKYRPEGEDETVMSAMDTAKLVKFIVEEHPEFSKYTTIQSFKFRERDKDPIINLNWMLEANKNVPNFRSFAYEGLDGMKTGFTEEAKNTFAGTAERDGMRLISVVMGAETKASRFTETRKLLDYGFNNFEVKQIIDGNTVVEGFETVDVKKGKETEVKLVTNKPLSFMVPKGSDGSSVTFEGKIDNENLTAPVKKGTKAGTVTYTYKIEGMKNVQKGTVDLVTYEDTEKAGWFKLFLRAIQQFFADLFESIKNLF